MHSNQLSRRSEDLERTATRRRQKGYSPTRSRLHCLTAIGAPSVHLQRYGRSRARPTIFSVERAKQARTGRRPTPTKMPDRIDNPPVDRHDTTCETERGPVALRPALARHGAGDAMNRTGSIAHRKGYEVSLVWPDISWNGDYNSDNLKFSDDAQRGLADFAARRRR